MPDPQQPTASPAATSGRACGHWNGTKHCGKKKNLHFFLTGWRCPSCTPAKVAGEPEPPEGHCAPSRCYCRKCPSWTEHNAYATSTDSWVTDARNIASGKKRANPSDQAAAKATVADQKAREAALRKGAA